ncbi:hypothetical protein MAPG_05807 [Magnaporthiopsis poae ATCC 64411]|uniref:Uncharacterized protein n=1 Tax=Magnaporthiopsis poae (strain ATCC 64411 / 73-15) TaxID=644358 RepID=A0A0C4E0D4_MAGP6|nr:hypothetical protein MAPG_05807 [Magnaporthiopsis poae ATCC 64411]
MAKLTSENNDLRTCHTKREAELSAAVAELAGLKAHGGPVDAPHAAELKAAKDEIARLKSDEFQMETQNRLQELTRRNADMAKALSQRDEQNKISAAENNLLKSLLDAKDERISKLQAELAILKHQSQTRASDAQQYRGLSDSTPGYWATNNTATQQHRIESPAGPFALQSDAEFQSFPGRQTLGIEQSYALDRNQGGLDSSFAWPIQSRPDRLTAVPMDRPSERASGFEGARGYMPQQIRENRRTGPTLASDLGLDSDSGPDSGSVGLDLKLQKTSAPGAHRGFESFDGSDARNEGQQADNKPGGESESAPPHETDNGKKDSEKEDGEGKGSEKKVKE